MPPWPELRGVREATSPRCGGLVCKGAAGSDAYGQRGFANQALRPQTVATGTEGPVDTTDLSHFSSQSLTPVAFGYWKH